ncbi:MAG: pilus assembly protein PilM [Mahellales bacterium]|jgi:type IV pilus assembly protein PilM
MRKKRRTTHKRHRNIRKRRSLLGLDVGTKSIKMVHTIQDSNFRIVNWGAIDTPSNAITQTGLYDAMEFSQSIIQCYKEFRFKEKKVSICLSHPSVITREFNFPMLEHSEIMENIQLEMSEFMASQPEDFQLDYKIIGLSQQEGYTTQRVLAVAAPKALIQGYLMATKEAGLKPMYIDISVNIYSKMINWISNEHINPLDNNVICLVDIGYNTTNIVIFSEGTYYINKSLNTGISTMFPSDNEKLDILGQQQQNHEYGMDTMPDYQGINSMILEIGNVFHYYDSRNYTSSIPKILIAGGGGNVDGLAQYINQHLDIETKVLEFSDFNFFKRDPQDLPVGLYFKAIGTTIREDVEDA